MKRTYLPIALAAIAMIAVGSFVFALPQKTEAVGGIQPAIPSRMELKLECELPLTVQSSPVMWKDHAYKLVSLGSIRFHLDKETGKLTAEAKAGVSMFDNVDYDVSVALFDAAGNLLGAARTPCKVSREWLGRMVMSSATLPFDFGVSLNYPEAATFMMSVSERKVLTPDEWPKK